MLYQNTVAPGSAATQQTVNAAGLQVGLGVRPTTTETIQTQGDFNATGNPLDLAISGGGFFQVLLPNGQTGYTRSGSFHLDSQGTIVTGDGNPVQPAITIPPNATNVTIGTDGTVTVSQPGTTTATQVGQPANGALHKSRRFEQRRQQYLSRNNGLRRASDRHSGWV